MKKSKWWQDIYEREEVVANINESALNSQPYKTYEAYKKASDKFRAKTNLNTKEYAKNMADASVTYAELMLYNEYFKEAIKKVYLSHPYIKDLDLSCNNMESYGKRVGKFAKTLKKLNITEKDDVVEFLPMLRTSLTLSLAMRGKNGIETEKDYMEIANDFVADIKKVTSTMSKGQILNKVDCELDKIR